MSKLKSLVEAITEDVNKEDSLILTIYMKMTNTLFSLIKWAGIPFVIYLIVEAGRL